MENLMTGRADCYYGSSDCPREIYCETTICDLSEDELDCLRLDISETEAMLKVAELIAYFFAQGSESDLTLAQICNTFTQSEKSEIISAIQLKLDENAEKELGII